MKSVGCIAQSSRNQVPSLKMGVRDLGGGGITYFVARIGNVWQRVEANVGNMPRPAGDQCLGLSSVDNH